MQQHPSFRLAGLVEPDPIAAHHAMSRLGLPADRCFATFKDALATTEADAALVIVPPHLTIEALEANRAEARLSGVSKAPGTYPELPERHPPRLCREVDVGAVDD